VPLEVVRRYDDDGEIRPDNRLQACCQLGATNAAGQHDDPHRWVSRWLTSPMRATAPGQRGRQPGDHGLEAELPVGPDRVCGERRRAEDHGTSPRSAPPFVSQLAREHRLGLAGVIAQDHREADRHVDGGRVATHLRAMRPEDPDALCDHLERPARIPGVAEPRKGAQGLLRAGAPIMIGRCAWTGRGRSDASWHRVEPALVRDLVAVEQPAHEPNGLVEAVQPLAEARSEVDAESVVLAFEPGPADAQDGRPSLMWSRVVASFAVSPGLANVFAPTMSPRRIRVVAPAQPASDIQPSKIG